MGGGGREGWGWGLGGSGGGEARRGERKAEGGVWRRDVFVLSHHAMGTTASVFLS